MISFHCAVPKSKIGPQKFYIITHLISHIQINIKKTQLSYKQMVPQNILWDCIIEGKKVFGHNLFFLVKFENHFMYK